MKIHVQFQLAESRGSKGLQWTGSSSSGPESTRMSNPKFPTQPFNPNFPYKCPILNQSIQIFNLKLSSHYLIHIPLYKYSITYFYRFLFLNSIYCIFYFCSLNMKHFFEIKKFNIELHFRKSSKLESNVPGALSLRVLVSNPNLISALCQVLFHNFPRFRKWISTNSFLVDLRFLEGF